MASFPPIRNQIRRLTFLLGAFVVFSSLADAQTTYRVLKLPTLGGKETNGLAINNSSQVVGSSSSPTNGFAFLWTKSGGIEELGNIEGYPSSATAINSSGEVAGTEIDPSGIGLAYLWTPTGGIQQLGTLGGAYSGAGGINSSGQIVGSSWIPSTTVVTHAFLWTAGTMQDLGTLGGPDSYGGAINDSAQVVGSATLSDGSSHAFLWTSSGGMQDLGTLGGSTSWATAINNNGQVTGTAYTSAGLEHAFLWTAATGMQDLGTPATSNSMAYAMNASGEVVGTYWGPGGSGPFLWTPTSGMTTLGPFGADNISVGVAINDWGQILASRYIYEANTSGYTSYLLTPILPTVTVVTSSQNPSADKQTIRLIATVTSSGPTPTGRVAFLDGTTKIGTVPIVNGAAVVVRYNLAPGTHSITANYLGDYNSATSVSTPLLQVVN